MAGTGPVWFGMLSNGEVWPLLEGGRKSGTARLGRDGLGRDWLGKVWFGPYAKGAVIRERHGASRRG